MTNEEKAKELIDNIWNCDNSVVRESIKIASRIAAEQMANWKDEQFIKFVNNNKGKFKSERARNAFIILLTQMNL